MKAMLRRNFLCFFLFLFFSPALAQDLQSQKVPRILLVHSYHPEYRWVQGVTGGVQAALKGQPHILDIFYMDTKRYASQEWMASAGKKARERIAEFQPDVVIAVDDNAQAFVTRHYLNRRPAFVFCGVNGNLEDYGFPADNVTGILERPFISESLNLLREIDPSVKKLAVMSDPGKTSLGALTYIRQHMGSFQSLDFKVVDEFSLWKKRILEFNDTADAVLFYTYHTIKEAPEGASLPPEMVMGWTRGNIRIPSVGFLDFTIEDGALCGVVESSYEHGLEAGQIALRIIAGELPSRIPIATAKKGTSMVNAKTARLLGFVIPDKVLKSVDMVIDEK